MPLHKLGFSSSYPEVLKFNKYAAIAVVSSVQSCDSLHFIQYAADNVDHNICTLDGNHTFHGMGMIAAATPAIKTRSTIPRKKVTNEELQEAGKVDIVYGPESPPRQEKSSFDKLNVFLYTDPTANLNVIWKTSILFGKPRPSWAGTMQKVHKGSHPGVPSIVYLPMIDMNPSHPICIRSSDVWQGTSGTSRDVLAVGLESLSGLKMCCEQIFL